MIGAKGFPGNPYDGHTLAGQIEQTNIIVLDQNVNVKTAYVDLGYPGVDESVGEVTVIHRGKGSLLTPKEKKKLKLRQAIEPTIGHIRHDHGMQRCWLKGCVATGSIRAAAEPVDTSPIQMNRKHSNRQP